MVKRSALVFIIFISAINSLFATTGYTISSPIYYNHKNTGRPLEGNDGAHDCLRLVGPMKLTAQRETRSPASMIDTMRRAPASQPGWS